MTQSVKIGIETLGLDEAIRYDSLAAKSNSLSLSLITRFVDTSTCNVMRWSTALRGRYTSNLTKMPASGLRIVEQKTELLYAGKCPDQSCRRSSVA